MILLDDENVYIEGLNPFIETQFNLIISNIAHYTIESDKII
jgi:hypothetical protein